MKKYLLMLLSAISTWSIPGDFITNSNAFQSVLKCTVDQRLKELEGSHQTTNGDTGSTGIKYIQIKKSSTSEAALRRNEEVFQFIMNVYGNQALNECNPEYRIIYEDLLTGEKHSVIGNISSPQEGLYEPKILEVIIHGQIDQHLICTYCTDTRNPTMHISDFRARWNCYPNRAAFIMIAPIYRLHCEIMSKRLNVDPTEVEKHFRYSLDGIQYSGKPDEVHFTQNVNEILITSVEGRQGYVCFYPLSDFSDSVKWVVEGTCSVQDGEISLNARDLVEREFERFVEAGSPQDFIVKKNGVEINDFFEEHHFGPGVISYPYINSSREIKGTMHITISETK